MEEKISIAIIDRYFEKLRGNLLVDVAILSRGAVNFSSFQ